ncbi:peroxidase family protein [Nocardioides terrigena]|uniref:peroxidase family protein n=1 Tax=Nocardioides terrigena TaxID=424797 RepID=UPI00131EF687|nr:peroxidase family protein [Nocardioides terrigena]
MSTGANAAVGQGFNLNRSDLRFIMRQIKISEQHAATRTPANPCGTLVGSGEFQVPATGNGRELPWGLRTVDGTCNNLFAGREKWGAADTEFPRHAPASFRAAEGGTTYASKSGTVQDSQPRRVSNLIVDQSANNPAAVEAAGTDPVVESGTLQIPNVAPDVGLSAPYNSVFTLFGQFFDHGLDLVTKGGGSVFMPLQADDPLFVPGSPTNFMVLTRATNRPGPDGLMGTEDDIQEAANTTTAFVDQNQTYTSHPSHQVFVRHFELNGDGDPVETGGLLEGPGGGMATWGTVKAQAAAMLGIQLSDADVLNVPLLATDPYGNFTRGPGGFPQIVTADGLVEGDPAANGNQGVSLPANTLRTGHAFLDDIAHNAVPSGTKTPDTDTVVNGPGPLADSTTYDDEMLNAHFVAGDGRVNENIGLTAIHHVFHSEHNRLVEDIKNVITTTEVAPNLADWVSPAGVWDGDRLFQAAKFVTEMEYQHLAFEEFARKVQPMVNAFGEGGTGYNAAVNPSIRAEFAHAVYRFGHSMLNETVARRSASGANTSMPLLQAFLNPPAFRGPTNALTADQAAGAIFRGSARQVGNEIDEFVTGALRNSLLGLPLDLASINMARAREQGVPTLNEARRRFYAESNNSAVAPYENWADFMFGLRRRESFVNFIAAYGRHPDITGTNAARRDVANAIVHGANGPDGQAATADDPTAPVPTDAVDFLNSTGTWATQSTGLEDIDLWMGGLAEKPMVFGGLLGPTFNYVFEKQMEDLQDGDRFYYLSRTAGLNLLTQLEGNSFAELIMRNTDVTALPADVFSRPDFVFEVANLGTTGPVPDDVLTEDWNEGTELTRMANGTLRYAGPAHVVFNGVDCGEAPVEAPMVLCSDPRANDRVWSSEGDDTIRGNGGNDWMQGGDGVDNLIGGLGDDILNDLAGDDTLKGGDGDDALSSGQGFGADLNQGGRGNDFIVGGNDMTETFAGPGDDYVMAGDGEDTVFGDDGDDWMEGGRGPFNLLQGDNGAPFQDDPNEPGHDVLMGYGGETDYDSEGGDDIMLLGNGIQRSEGMLGFDWATHKSDPFAGDSDMEIIGALPPSVETNKDRFDLVEALSGWTFDDTLRGDDRAAADLGTDHELNAAGIARIAGLQAVLGTGVTSFQGGNIILGGAGSDLIEGRGGDDVIDGDKWLNVQVEAPNVATADTADTILVDNLAALQADVFAGRIDPGSLRIVRTVETTPAGAGTDTALFSGAQTEYTITENADGTTTVAHTGGTGLDGTDTLRGIEAMQFAGDPVATAPGAVTGVTAVAGDTQATVSFTAPADNGGSPITEFRVQVLVGGVVQNTVTGIAPTATSTVVTGLTNGTPVTFQVIAVNAVGAGPASAPSAAVTPSANAAPTVTATSPLTGATGVAVGGNITATFSEAVAGISGATFTLRQGTDTTGALVASAVTSTATTATLNPTANLAAGTVYTARLLTGITDSAGAPLAPVTWSFTTAAGNVAPTVTARTPAINATGVAVGDNVTATFSEPVVGVTGARFTLRQGTTATGALVGRAVTYNAATQTATLNPNANLAANTVYTARLFAGITDTTGLALAGAPVTWSFTTAGAANAAPTVTARTPAVNATGVAVGNNITATFSEAVSGISGATFTLRQGTATTGALVAGAVSSTATTATLNPTANLAANTVYTARLLTGITDSAGAQLAPVTWSFTTAATAPATVPGRPAIGIAVQGAAAGGAINATANWPEATNTGGSPITGYRIRALRMSAAGAVLATTTSAVQPAAARTLLMTLPVAGNYRFTVQAINAIGNSQQSLRSNLVAGR